MKHLSPSPCLCRTWTSQVSERSWRSMTRFWRRRGGLTGEWLMLKWLHFTHARKSHSSSLRLRCIHTHAHKLNQECNGKTHSLLSVRKWATLKTHSVFQALVTTELEGGDRQRAMKRLRVPPLGAAQVWDTHTHLVITHRCISLLAGELLLWKSESNILLPSLFTHTKSLSWQQQNNGWPHVPHCHNFGTTELDG